MRRITLSALALVGSLGVTAIARAGCCDDFWSCLGAVASAGVSCQIQGIIDTVKSMQQLVQTLTNDLRNRSGDMMAQAQKAVGDAANDIKQVREQSIADLKKFADKAHEIANPPKSNAMLAPALAGGALKQSTVAARPMGAAAAVAVQGPPMNKGLATGTAMPAAKPAEPSAITDALSRADTYLQDLKNKAGTPANDIARAETAAVDAAARHLRTAQQISLDMALTPLKILGDSLLDLLTHPERIFDPSAQIEADVQRITAQVPAMLDRIFSEITQDAMAGLQQAKDNLQQLQDSASASQAIVDKMEKVAGSKLQSDLDALNGLLPRQPAAGAQLASRGLLLPTTGFVSNRALITTAFSRTDQTKIPIFVQHRAAVNDIAAKWQTIKTRIKTPVALEPGSSQKVDHDLGQMFTGKAKPDIDKKKQELLEEAKKRFANDPKTLEKVKQYIETHAPKG